MEERVVLTFSSRDHIYSEGFLYTISHIPLQIYMKWLRGNWGNSKLRVQFEFHRVLLSKLTFCDLWLFWAKNRLLSSLSTLATLLPCKIVRKNTTSNP